MLHFAVLWWTEREREGKQIGAGLGIGQCSNIKRLTTIRTSAE